MYIMVYNPNENRENIREFNDRLDETCADNPIVDITAQCIGSALILSLTAGDDADAEDGRPTLTAAIKPVDTRGEKGADLEGQLDALLNRESARHTEQEPRVPFHLLSPSRKDDPTKGYAVLLSVNGAVEDENPDNSNDIHDQSTDEDDDEDPPAKDAVVDGFPGGKS